ncbi:hypothetical protein B0H12DRAFT_1138421, partial [Mycena haematopus]
MGCKKSRLPSMISFQGPGALASSQRFPALSLAIWDIAARWVWMLILSCSLEMWHPAVDHQLVYCRKSYRMREGSKSPSKSDTKN